MSNTPITEWISVDKYLPQSDFEVLVCQDDDVFTAIFREFDVGYYFEGAKTNHEHITHWMPLPSPPTNIKE